MEEDYDRKNLLDSLESLKKRKFLRRIHSLHCIRYNNLLRVIHQDRRIGFALFKGEEPLNKNSHHFWEILVTKKVALEGDDMIIGVVSSKVLVDTCVIHGYSSRFARGDLIGLHFDMTIGRLQFYLNRNRLGEPFDGLKSQELYPIIGKVSFTYKRRNASPDIFKKTSFVMTYKVSLPFSLKITTLKFIGKNPELYERFLKTPVVANIFLDKFYWILPHNDAVSSD